MKMFFSGIKQIKSKEELTGYIGDPSPLVKAKPIDHLDSHCRTFLAHSPFAVLSTSDENGRCDASPRGDHPGFVYILDEHHLIIPERPGNKRMDTLKNLLENNRIGLLFLIPGFGETLRINGKGVVIKDEEILAPLSVRGKAPSLGIGVEVEECFIHCAKAMKRSGIWDQERWPDTGAMPTAARMLSDHAALKNQDENALAKRLEKGYRENLY
ncbi:pyridoxamine 5'-phosphate oxidase family protein [Bacillus sp. H-16]|nr:pyridoxamine 5'-phosphate oxidase family protein [Alteribacter salitolerans]MBM7094938.1 pyridoxamine 5'-phosphate oxidase family protein [Alteribacter salitolerans]